MTVGPRRRAARARRRRLRGRAVPARAGGPVDRLAEPDDLELRRLALIEERDRSQDALRELEFDHRTGKLSDEDYRALVGPLRRRAAEARRALEPRGEGEERVRAGG